MVSLDTTDAANGKEVCLDKSVQNFQPLADEHERDDGP
jgi:hypothetical protein